MSDEKELYAKGRVLGKSVSTTLQMWDEQEHPGRWPCYPARKADVLEDFEGYVNRTRDHILQIERERDESEKRVAILLQEMDWTDKQLTAEQCEKERLREENEKLAKVASKRLNNDTAMINEKLKAQGLREENEKLKAREVELVAYASLVGQCGYNSQVELVVDDLERQEARDIIAEFEERQKCATFFQGI